MWYFYFHNSHFIEDVFSINWRLDIPYKLPKLPNFGKITRIIIKSKFP